VTGEGTAHPYGWPVPTARYVRSRLPGWLALATLSAAGSGLLAVAGLPSPVLFGGLLAGLTYAIAGRAPIVLPARLFNLGQALVAVTIGELVDLSTLRTVGAQWAPTLGVTLGTLLVSVVAGQALRLHRDVSAVTGAFAMIAGGASGITALARELGADDRVVTIVQYLRVLLVLLVMPLVTAVAFSPPRSPATTVAPTGDAGIVLDLVFVFVSIGVGGPLARLARLPAGWLLGPLLVAVALVVSGWLGEVSVPSALADLGYLLIGVQVGLRFTRESLRSIAGLLPLAVALILAVIAACAAMGMLLARLAGTTYLTGYLATTPGGLYAVLATAATSGSDVTFVLAVQVIRVFVMLLAAPGIARLMRRGLTSRASDGGR
jgi:membrane AbrB-like protein